MADAPGFAYETRADGTVAVTHRGRVATLLRGGRAARFLGKVAAGDPRLVMARWTGNYRRGWGHLPPPYGARHGKRVDRGGGERTAKRHPRNAQR